MKQKPNILQILPALNSGGVERGTIDLAIGLKEKGYGSYVCSSGGVLCDILHEKNIPHITLPVASKNPFVMCRNKKRLKKVILENDIDLVHVRSRAPAWSSYYACQAANTPMVTTFHGCYSAQNKIKKFYNSSMLSGIATIASNEFMKRHIQDTYEQYPPIHIIPRWINFAEFDLSAIPQEKINAKRAEWGIPENKIIVLLPGRYTSIKGHTLLVKALSAVSDPDVYFVAIGNQKNQAQLMNNIKQTADLHSLSDRVKLLDLERDMVTAYLASDLIVNCTTKPETFGRTIVEAMALKKPVLVAKHGALGYMIEDEVNGWLCEPNDAASLAMALKKAIYAIKSGDANQVTEQAYHFAKSNYDFENILQQKIDFYEGIVG